MDPYLNLQEPMAFVASTSEYVAALQEHQLLEPAQLQEVTDALQVQFDDPVALSRAIADRSWLTSYQAEQVLKGKASDLVFGPYRILELLGEGGMGQVFKALHRRLYRIVALKVIRQDRLSKDPEVVKRFQREAQAAAQLSHPNVVLIYDADQVDQTHFLTMEYVEGVDLAQLVKQKGPLTVEQACEYMRQSALGLQHAHERGLIHRDIKPSNLLVTYAAPKSYLKETSGTNGPSMSAPIAGIVKILDMGLARVNNPTTPSSGTSFHTEAGVVMGTPDFIAPEQARNPRGVDHRADLYSLGCTFYFLLTGRPPFVEGSAIEKMLSHQMDEPEPVEDLRPDVPPYVASVIRRLMAKRPADRFNSAEEAAEALAVQTGPSTTPSVSLPPAPPPSEMDQSTAVVRVAPHQVEKERSKETPRDLTPVILPDSVTKEAARQDRRDSEFRRESGEVRKDGGDGAKQIALLRGHRSWVLSTCFSHDRNLLASGGVDGSIRVWGFSSSVPKERAASQPMGADVRALAVSPDSQYLATASGALDGTVALWSIGPNGIEGHKRLAGHQAAVEALIFTPDGKTVASAGADRVVRLWDVAGTDVRERGSFKGHVGTVQALAVSPDGKTFASGGHDSVVRLWAPGKLWNTEQATLRGHYGNIGALAFSPDGKVVASGGSDAAILLWDAAGDADRRPRAILEGHQSAIRLLIFTPGENKLLSVSDRGRTILWDLDANKPEREWPAPGMMVCSASMTFDGRYLALGRNDGTIAVFRQYPKR
jgi:serine/threonine protein kinase